MSSIAKKSYFSGWENCAVPGSFSSSLQVFSNDLNYPISFKNLNASDESQCLSMYVSLFFLESGFTIRGGALGVEEEVARPVPEKVTETHGAGLLVKAGDNFSFGSSQSSSSIENVKSDASINRKDQLSSQSLQNAENSVSQTEKSQLSNDSKKPEFLPKTNGQSSKDPNLALSSPEKLFSTLLPSSINGLAVEAQDFQTFLSQNRGIDDWNTLLNGAFVSRMYIGKTSVTAGRSLVVEFRRGADIGIGRSLEVRGGHNLMRVAGALMLGLTCVFGVTGGVLWKIFKGIDNIQI